MSYQTTKGMLMLERVYYVGAMDGNYLLSHGLS